MFKDIIKEAMSAASYQKLDELRSLYYGRLDVYVSFTDDGEYITEDDFRPNGIVCHSVDTVVGRKASTNLLYGRVFRIRKNRGDFLEDIRTYSADDLKKDLEAISSLRYIKDVDEESYDVLYKYQRNFEKLWFLTKELSQGDGKVWAKILTDIGYKGFKDPHGYGLFDRKRSPAAILLNTSAKEDFDIVPMQKYRTDKRSRVVNSVKREVERLSTQRNRVAKRKVTRYDSDSSGKNVIRKIVRDYIKSIGVM